MSGPICILLDTCSWANLAQDPKNREVLEALERCSGATFLLPEPVETEFNRHDWARSYAKRLKGKIGAIAEVGRHIEELQEQLAQASQRASTLLAALDTEVQGNVQIVRRIFASAGTWRPTPDDYEDACRRCLQIIPPARGPFAGRSAVGDCLIWRAVLHALGTGEVLFCTDNKHDFCTRDDPRVLHPELLQECGPEREHLHFFSGVQQLLAGLQKREILDDAPVYRPPGEDCPVCGTTGSVVEAGWRRSAGGLEAYSLCTSCRAALPTGEFAD